MIGLDTNVVVRFLVDDDEVQGKRARNAIARGASFYLSTIVLCELVWVLERSYAYPKARIADILDGILRVNKFSVERPDDAWRALASYRANQGGFADALIASAATDAGCDVVLTFDKSLQRMPAFRQL